MAARPTVRADEGVQRMVGVGASERARATRAREWEQAGELEGADTHTRKTQRQKTVARKEMKPFGGPLCEYLAKREPEGWFVASRNPLNVRESVRGWLTAEDTLAQWEGWRDQCGSFCFRRPVPSHAEVLPRCLFGHQNPDSAVVVKVPEGRTRKRAGVPSCSRCLCVLPAADEAFQNRALSELHRTAFHVNGKGFGRLEPVLELHTYQTWGKRAETG